MSNVIYKRYVLVLLTLVAALNYLDRYVLAILLEPIKHDLSLSDSQLGFLTGFAFALFYAVAGIPIARWADKGNRNTIVYSTTFLWSAMVAICGLVGNYTQLLLARIGVAVGEAGCLPPGQSLVSDYFDRSERPHAMAIYWLCSPIAIIIGYLAGGFLGDSLGWRMTFIAIGLPGVAVAILVKLTLKEPRLLRSQSDQISTSSFTAVIKTLIQRNAFRHLAIAFCINYFFMMGIFQWVPTFYIRSYGMSATEVGSWLALIWGGCGFIGTYLGGYLVSAFASGKERTHMQWVTAVIAFEAIIFAIIYSVFDKQISLALMAIVAFLGSCVNAPIFSAIQGLANERMRSVALAIIFLMANLIGFGLGPIAVGVLSDRFNPSFGQESLRYAMLVFSPGLLWAAYHFWRVSFSIEQDIKMAEEVA
ncbi:spinster family MFS transporter [SAR92 clade bacterium H246]